MVRVLDFGEFQPKSAADKGAGRHWKLVVRLHKQKPVWSGGCNVSGGGGGYKADVSWASLAMR